jgi:hypothetical protein
MGTSQSQYRPHSSHHHYFHCGPTWGQPHNVAPHMGYGHHRHVRPAFGFGAPPPRFHRHS